MVFTFLNWKKNTILWSVKKVCAIQTSVSINKVLSKNTAHPLGHYICGHCHTKKAELSGCDRQCGWQSLEYLLSGPLLRGWPIPNLKYFPAPLPAPQGLSAGGGPSPGPPGGIVPVTCGPARTGVPWVWVPGLCPHQRPLDLVWVAQPHPVSCRVWGSQAFCPLRGCSVDGFQKQHEFWEPGPHGRGLGGAGNLPGEEASGKVQVSWVPCPHSCG